MDLTRKYGKDFSLINSTTSNISSKIAEVIVYTYRDVDIGTTIMEMKAFIMYGNKAYQLIYSAEPTKFSVYLPTIQKMIDSFKIVNTNNSVEPFLTYENPTFGIKVQYPYNWTKEEDQNSQYLVRFFPSGARTPSGEPIDVSNSIRFDVGKASYRPNATVEEYLTERANLGKKGSTNFKTIELDTNTTFANHQAYKMIYDYQKKDTGTDEKIIEIGTMNQNDAYYIRLVSTSEAYNKNLPIVQKISDSFQTFQPKSKFLLYHNPALGIKIQYPYQWANKIVTNQPWMNISGGKGMGIPASIVFQYRFPTKRSL